MLLDANISFLWTYVVLQIFSYYIYSLFLKKWPCLLSFGMLDRQGNWGSHYFFRFPKVLWPFSFQFFMDADVDCVLYLQSGHNKHERLEKDRGSLITNFFFIKESERSPTSYLPDETTIIFKLPFSYLSFFFNLWT
jgi:hypothetical protein